MEAKKIAVRAPNEQEQQLKQAMLKQLHADRSIIMMLHPFTASLSMNLNMQVVVDDRLPTAATDGETLFFNAQFMSEQSEQDRRFIVAHEVWHCVLSHQARRMGREARKWNYAADYELNHILHEELGFHPEQALFEPRFHNMSAEQIYRALERRPRINRNQKVLDEHDIWEAFNNKGGLVMDPDFTPRLKPNVQQQKNETQSWQTRILNAAKSTKAGNLPSAIQQLIKDITQPKVPWQTLLERFLQKQRRGDERAWLPPARRHIHRGLYLPSQTGSRLQAAVAIDTSGSCHSELKTFISELKGILGGFNQVELTVLCFDVAVHTTMQLTHNDLHQLDSLKMKAGGGTSFQPVFDELEKHPTLEALIFFTDGHALAPENSPNYPVLWVLTESGSKPAEWGEEVRVG